MALITQWHSLWKNPNSKQTFSYDLQCSKYTLDFGCHHDTLSMRLQAQQANPSNSTLDVLRRQYERRGHQFRPHIAVPSLHDACVESPDARYMVKYQIMALNGTRMESAVRTMIDPEFTLAPLLSLYCRRYGVPEYDMPILFPSMRFNTANVRYMQPVRRRGKKKRQQHTKSDERYDRLIPLVLLPLLLDLMPGYYQCCNNIVAECMQMRDALLMDGHLSLCPSHVKEQLRGLQHNCRVLGFWQQQSRYNLRAQNLIPHRDRNEYNQLQELFSLQRQQEYQHATLLYYCESLDATENTARQVLTTRGTTQKTTERSGSVYS
jgi:hypothetical protein